MYLPHVLSLADIAPANPCPLAPLTLLISFQTAASVLGLAGPVEYACPPQMADVLASQSVQLSLVSIPAKSPESNAKWTHVPGADLQGQMCRIPGHLSLPCSVPLLPACGLRSGKGLGLVDCGSATLPFFCVVSSFSPGIGGLFCSLQLVCRFSCICCSCFLGVCVGGGFCLAFLFYHLEPLLI